MQKKKNSVMLVSLMVVVGLGLVIANSTDIQKNLTDIFNHKNEPPVATGPGSKANEADKEQFKSQLAMQAQVKKGGPIAVDDEGETAMDKAIPDTPTILIPKSTKFKPQQNESTITSRWYDPNSNVKNKEADAAQKTTASGG